MRIEPFFGAGGAYFSLPKPKYAILNDIDDDVCNLFLVIKDQKEAFKQALHQMPISSSLVRHWQKHHETDPILKAIRFVLLSNFTMMGKGDTLRLGLENSKQKALADTDKIFSHIAHAQISSYDFREVIPKIDFAEKGLPKKDAFVYLDPVYLGTTYTYQCPRWTEDDTADCMELMKTCGIKSAMSEFDHPRVVAMAKERKLQIIPVKERRNIKKRSTEILITNYQPNHTLFDYEP